MNSLQVKDMTPQQVVDRAEPLYEVSWRASDDSIEALFHILGTVMPKSILEFGPGWSSHMLHHYCAVTPGTTYLGIDHENEYAHEHLKKLKQCGMPTDTTHIVPLDPIDDWYIIPKFRTKFDLILIDGPGSDLSRRCERALETYVNASDPRKTVWMVDDTTRPASAWLAARWLPDYLKASTTNVIRDRHYPRHTSVIYPINIHGI